MDISSESSVCRPCRQDVTHAVADSGYTPRWEKGTKTPRDQCFVLDCTEFSIAHMSVSTDELSDVHNIQFKSETIPTPTPLCYHVLYDMLQTRQKHCRTCSRCLRLGNDKPCPQPEAIKAYLCEHTDFTGDMGISDHVCVTCYKLHLAILKKNQPASRDEDLKALVESVKHHITSMVHNTIELQKCCMK